MRVRPVPEGHAIYKLTVVGVTPYLHHSCNPDRTIPEFTEYHELVGMSKRTKAQDERLGYLDWRLGLHWLQDLGPFVPTEQVVGCLAAAGGKYKIGATVRRTLIVSPYEIPLQYDGPRDIDGLWNEGFVHATMAATAGMNRGRINRVRGCFDEWKVECEIAVSPDDIGIEKLDPTVRRAADFGLGDGRTIGYGRFVGKLEFVRAQDAKHAEADVTRILQQESEHRQKSVHKTRNSQARGEKPTRTQKGKFAA